MKAKEHQRFKYFRAQNPSSPQETRQKGKTKSATTNSLCLPRIRVSKHKVKNSNPIKKNPNYNYGGKKGAIRTYTTLFKK